MGSKKDIDKTSGPSKADRESGKADYGAGPVDHFTGDMVTTGLTSLLPAPGLYPEACHQGDYDLSSLDSPESSESEPNELQVGTVIEDDTWDVLASFIGCIDAPADWAINHDYYLHGVEKQK